MIAVFDTNVLVAALVTDGICSRLLLRARRKEVSLAICPFILSEVQRVLLKKFHASKDESANAMRLIREAADYFVEHAMTVEGISRDADDDNVLACALAAKANYLVTGDTDLLVIKTFQGIQILTPRDFELLFD